MHAFRFLTIPTLVVCAMAVSSCQSGDAGSVLNVGGKKDDGPTVTAAELRAFCPRVELREGTAYFNKYRTGAKKRAPEIEPIDDAASRPGDIVYQAAIEDVTRSCSFPGGQVVMTVAVAGKVVPGNAFAVGSITMPIRIVVVRGDEVLYSKLHQFPVQVAAANQATQFIFTDQEVAFPAPADSRVRVFAGYDEGPPPKAATQ